MNQGIPTTVYHDSYNIASNLQYSLSLHANFTGQTDELDKISEFLFISLLCSVLEPVATLNWLENSPNFFHCFFPQSVAAKHNTSFVLKT